MANEMNFGMNHAPGAGVIAQPVDLPSLLCPCDWSDAGLQIIGVKCKKVVSKCVRGDEILDRKKIGKICLAL